MSNQESREDYDADILFGLRIAAIIGIELLIVIIIGGIKTFTEFIG